MKRGRRKRRRSLRHTFRRGYAPNPCGRKHRRRGRNARKKHRRHKRKASGYARFVKAMWAKNRARYKRMDFGKVGREIADAYKGCSCSAKRRR